MTIQDLIDELKRVGEITGFHAAVEFSDEEEGIVRNHAGCCRIGACIAKDVDLEEEVTELESKVDDRDGEIEDLKECINEIVDYFADKEPDGKLHLNSMIEGVLLKVMNHRTFHIS